MPSQAWFPAGTAWVLAGCLLGAGCSKSPAPTGQLTGKVTYNGKAVTGGTMRFFFPTKNLKEQASFRCMIRPDGTYTAAGVPTGKMKVTITTETVRATSEARERFREAGAKSAKGKPPSGTPPSLGTYMEIPAKYGNPKKTDLFVDITGGEQEWSPDLKD